MDDWTLIALEEYKTLRTERLQAIQNQHSALRLGALAVTFLLGSAFTLTRDYPFIAYLELTFFSPFIIVLITLNWATEHARARRVGNYLSVLEREINLNIGKNALNWEQWLRSGFRFYGPHLPVLAFFLVGGLCIVAGIYTGIYVCGLKASNHNLAFPPILGSLLLVISILSIALQLSKIEKSFFPETRVKEI